MAEGLVLDLDSIDGVDRPRRWPAVVAGLVAVLALGLTSALMIVNHENALAASAAAANAQRDALAVVSLNHVSQSIVLADDFEHVGVYGYRAIDVRSFRSLVVAPLGATLVSHDGTWSLALDGGWACMRLEAHGQPLSHPTITRGVCGGAPIDATPTVSLASVTKALARADGAQRAALDAAYASALFASTAEGYEPRFSIEALRDRFNRLSGSAFHADVTSSGVTITTPSSVACVRPVNKQQAVDILDGSCH